MLSEKGRLDEKAIMKVAARIGLDMKRLKADMESQETENLLQKSVELGTNMQVNGTPTFIIGDELVPQALSKDQMKALIADIRKRS